MKYPLAADPMRAHAPTPADDLVTLCRRGAPDHLDAREVEALLADARLPGLLEAASAHGVAGMVVEALVRAADATGNPSDAAARLRETRRALRRRAALLVEERDALAEALGGAGIPAVALKGSALVGTVYREPAERDLGDIDFLVEPDRVAAAVSALGRRGYAPPSDELIDVYRRHHFHLPLRRDPMPLVEVHWALTRGDSAHRLDAGVVLRGARSAAGPAVPRAEHTLLHLVLQNVQEGFSRFSRIVDIDRLLVAETGLDWEEIGRLARDGALGPATALTLRLAEDLLGTRVPRGLALRLAPDPTSRFHLALLAPRTSLLERRFRRRFSDEQLLLLWLLPHWRPRVTRLIDLVLRDPEMPSGMRRGLVARASIPLKLAVRQLGLYARVAAAPGSPEARHPMRFWSSQANSSERL